ncbi:MAG: hypothetical protein M3319_05320 [Actinomycetota bacterium]|nr:hypothetical protein [Actinomycetota bacterium]
MTGAFEHTLLRALPAEPFDTALDAGTAWMSTLPCRRRPARRPCQGRMIVLRSESQVPI